MRNVILTIGLFFMITVSKAQDDGHNMDKDSEHKNITLKKNWKQGYAVTLNGDTIRGFIKDKPPADIAEKHVLTLETAMGSKMKFMSDSLRQYSILSDNGSMDYKIYASIKLNDYDRENTFMKLYVDGPCKVFGLFEINASPGMTSINEYKYLKVGEGPLTAPFKTGFKRDMKKLFSMCPAIIAKIQSEEYNYTNWQQMVTDYNNGLCK